MPQALLKGLSLLVLTLVVVGCTSGGGSLSDVERREIDAVLDTFLEGVRSGEPSLMADALAEEVALGVSADDIGSFPKDAIVMHLDASVKELVKGESLSVAAQSGKGLQLDFIDRRIRGRRTEGWVEGILSVQGTALPVEFGLTKTARGWKIDGFRLLHTQSLEGTLTGEWSGNWWRVPRGDGEGGLTVTLHQDAGGNLSGEVYLKDFGCIDHATITEGDTRSSPFRWAAWTAVAERGEMRFITIDVQDTKMKGSFYVNGFDCRPGGWFELER